MKFRLFLLVIILALTCHSTYSQVYTFTMTETPYQELSDAVSINNGEVWSYPSYEINPGFSFYLFDTLINKLHFFEEAQGSCLSSSISTDRYHKMLMPFGAGLIDRGYPTSQSQSPISYKVTGEPGYRICKIEWKNAGFAGDFEENGITTDYVNFQLWLYETTGLIEMHYGPSHISDFEIDFGASGPAIGLIPWYDNDEYLFSPESLWLEGYPQNPGMYQSEMFLFLNGIMLPNTIYQFTNNLTVATDKIINEDLAIYPNPTRESINIRLCHQMKKEVLVRILNSSGKILSETVYTGSNQHINIPVQDLPAGVYHIKLESNNTISVGKFIKLP